MNSSWFWSIHQSLASRLLFCANFALNNGKPCEVKWAIFISKDVRFQYFTQAWKSIFIKWNNAMALDFHEKCSHSTGRSLALLASPVFYFILIQHNSIADVYRKSEVWQQKLPNARQWFPTSIEILERGNSSAWRLLRHFPRSWLELVMLTVALKAKGPRMILMWKRGQQNSDLKVRQMCVDSGLRSPSSNSRNKMKFNLWNEAEYDNYQFSMFNIVQG